MSRTSFFSLLKNVSSPKCNRTEFPLSSVNILLFLETSHLVSAQDQVHSNTKYLCLRFEAAFSRKFNMVSPMQSNAIQCSLMLVTKYNSMNYLMVSSTSLNELFKRELGSLALLGIAFFCFCFSSSSQTSLVVFSKLSCSLEKSKVLYIS